MDGWLKVPLNIGEKYEGEKRTLQETVHIASAKYGLKCGILDAKCLLVWA